MAMPHIKRISYRKWTNLESDDRVSEANLFFLAAYRSLPIGSGRFMTDYEAALIPHMKELNKKTPSRFYGRSISFDANRRNKSGNGTWSLMDRHVGSKFDVTALSVASFINSLPARDREIIIDLRDRGLSRTAVARNNSISCYMLNKILAKMGSDYLQGKW